MIVDNACKPISARLFPEGRDHIVPEISCVENEVDRCLVASPKSPERPLGCMYDWSHLEDGSVEGVLQLLILYKEKLLLTPMVLYSSY